MTALLALTVSAALATPASVPASPPARQPLIAQATRIASAAPGATLGGRRAVAAQNDSLKNGAVIGAVLGGVALGGFVGYLCYMLDETEGHGDCVKAGLLWGGIGAAGGAALGAGVDALFDRPMAVVRVRF